MVPSVEGLFEKTERCATVQCTKRASANPPRKLTSTQQRKTLESRHFNACLVQRSLPLRTRHRDKSISQDGLLGVPSVRSDTSSKTLIQLGKRVAVRRALSNKLETLEVLVQLINSEWNAISGQSLGTAKNRATVGCTVRSHKLEKLVTVRRAEPKTWAIVVEIINSKWNTMNTAKVFVTITSAKTVYTNDTPNVSACQVSNL